MLGAQLGNAADSRAGSVALNLPWPRAAANVRIHSAHFLSPPSPRFFINLPPHHILTFHLHLQLHPPHLLLRGLDLLLHKRTNYRRGVGRQGLCRWWVGRRDRLSRGKSGRRGERERCRREGAKRVPRERSRVTGGDGRQKRLGKAGLSKAGQWLPGEKAGGRQGVPGAGGQVFREAVQPLKNVLKTQRRWGGRMVWPVGHPQQGGGGRSCQRRKLLLLLIREKVATGCGLSWAKLLPVRSEGGGAEGGVGRCRWQLVEGRALAKVDTLLLLLLAEPRVMTEGSIWVESRALVEVRALMERRVATFLRNTSKQQVEVHSILVIVILTRKTLQVSPGR